jgi:hypothetical protein
MDRYLTQRYVAITWLEAIRLARLDGTPLLEIRCTRQVELIHRTDWWAWWSDERITTAIGLPDGLRPQGLSPDAVVLISEVWESESPAPQCGWNVLSRIGKIIHCTPKLPEGFDKNFRAGTWERIEVQFSNGELGELFRFRASDDEGYQCEVFLNPPC